MSNDVVSPPEKTFIPTDDDRTWGMLAHVSALIAMWLGGLSFLGPLIVYVIKKDQSAFVADQAREALNFHLACFLVIVLSAITCIGPVIVLVGMVIYSIIAAMEANKGIAYRYPYTIRFIS